MDEVSAALLAETPTVPFIRSAKYVGLGRTTAYELLQRGEFPIEVLKIGNLRKCRRVDLLRYLGIVPEERAG